MKKEQLHINNTGFSLVEILVAIGVFLIFVTMTVGVIVSSNKQLQNSGHKERATSLAEEAIEAVRNLRDANFNNLTDGTFGLNTVSSKWNLVSTPDITDIFTRTLNISSISTNQKKVVATVTWSDQISQNNSVSLNTYLTNWSAPLNIGLTIDKVVIGGTKVASDFLPYDLTTDVLNNTVDPPIFQNINIPIVFSPSSMTNLSPGLYSFLTTSDPNYDLSLSSACAGNSITLTDGPTICTITYTSNDVDCTGTPWGAMTSGTSNTAYLTSLPTGVCISELRTCTNGTLSGSYTATSCTAGCTGTLWGNVSSGYSNTAYLTSSVTYPSTCTSETRTCTAGTMSGTYTNTSCSVTPIAPTVTTTTPVTSITRTTATGGGNVTSDGGAIVTARGIVWDINSNPTIALSTKKSNGTGTGLFSSSITSLSCNTLYHVRAYATNSIGTSYGSDVTFTTSVCSNIAFVGANSANATTITIPAHNVGDLLIMFAYRSSSNAPPTIPNTWITIDSAGGANNSSVLAYRIATGSDTSGSWSNASQLIVQVYRGVSASPIGGFGAMQSANSTTVTYPAVTLGVTDGSSWIIGSAGAANSATTIETPPAGMTRRANPIGGSAEAVGFDTNGGVSSWSAQNIVIRASNVKWSARTLEIKSQ